MRKSAYARTSGAANNNQSLQKNIAVSECDYDNESNHFSNAHSSHYELRFLSKEEKIRFDRNTRRARVTLVLCTLFLFLLAFSRPIYGPYIDRFGEDGDASLIEVVKEHLTKRAERHGLNAHSSRHNKESTFHARYRRIEEERRALLEEHAADGMDETDVMRRLEVLEERAKNLLKEHAKKHGKKHTGNSNHESRGKGAGGDGGGTE
jgi:hypothetical protein